MKRENNFFSRIEEEVDIFVEILDRVKPIPLVTNGTPRTTSMFKVFF